MSRDRWPRWVYGTGDEPDYRFSFANERTFLAWIRTALALLAGGVALDTLPLAIADALAQTLAATLSVLGLLCALASWVRWARAERSMRRNEALPATMLTGILAAVVVLAAVAVLIAGFLPS